MHRRLIALLRSFSAEEMMRLDQFVRSPFFNESELLEILWTFYLSHAPDFSQADFNAEGAFAQLFPDGVFEQKKINKYNSYLYQLVQKFLSHQQLEGQEHQQMMYKLAYFDEAQLSAHFQQTLRQAQQKLDESPFRNANYYYQKLQLARAEYAYQSRRDERDGDIGLQNLNTALDTHFLIQKLKQVSIMLARQRAVKVVYRYSWLAEVETYLQMHPTPDNPAILIYHSMLVLQQDPGQLKRYLAFKNRLSQHASCFTPAEQRECYTILENAAKQCFAPAQYPHELFDLYRQQIDSQVWRQAEGIYHGLFRNVAGVAFNLGQFDWADHFIQEYAPFIVPHTFQEDVRALTEAEWHFYQNRPDAALSALQLANPSDVYYKLAAKSLLVRIYFRLRAFEALENALNTFTKFVHDQKKRIAPTKVASFRSFINYLRKLYKILSADATTYAEFAAQEEISSRAVQKKLKQLKKRIQEEAFFNGRQWLLGEIDGYFLRSQV